MSADSQSRGRALSRSLSRSFALHCAARAAEALALGFLAAAIVWSAVVWTQQSDGGAHTWIAAFVAGSAAAASMWLERSPDVHAHVRRVDERLGLNGALVTADDVSATAAPDSLAGALVARVHAQLAAPSLARASLPSTPLALVAILIGVGVLFAVHDLTARQAQGDAVVLDAAQARQATLTQAAAALRSAAARAVASGKADPAAQAVMAHLAAALEREARESAPTPAADTSTQAQLTEVLTGSELRPSERTALARARALFESGRSPTLAVDSPRTPGSGERGEGFEHEGAGKGAGGDAGHSGSSQTPSSASSDPAPPAGSLASAAASGKMVAPAALSGAAGGPSSTSSASERGVVGLRWWPTRHDAVVDAWVKSTNHPDNH
ncbi:MAG: hypothetical protein JNL28_14195 [Planctomycetes bacterium]|nr:hypothetical protein [Planctomycetota bacterium]